MNSSEPNGQPASNRATRAAGFIEAGWFGSLESFVVVERPQSSARKASTVLLLGPVGAQAQGLAASLRFARQRLVAQGHTVLQIDPPGTGLAAGDGFVGLDWQHWVAAASELVEAAAAQWPTQRIVLFGTQLGAAVAAELIARPELGIEDLIAWAPTTNGRRFLRAQRLLGVARGERLTPATTANKSGVVDASPGGVLEAGGFCYSEALQQAVSSIDLGGAPPPKSLQRALILDQDDLPSATPWTAAMRLQGVDVSAPTISGFRTVAPEDPESGVLPVDMVDAVGNWLLSLPAVEPTDPAQTESRPVAVSAVRHDRSRRFTESVVMIGDGPSLFGIETTPLSAGIELSELGSTTQIVVVPTGSNTIVGPGRLHVELARRLASEGASVLTFDRRGVGLSDDGLADQRESSVGPAYDPVTVEDLARVVAWLRLRSKATAINLIGTCSGATLSYRFALSGTSVMPIDRLISINQILWDTDESAVISSSIDAKVAEKFAHAARHPLALRDRLRSGDLDLAESFRRVSRHLKSKARDRSRLGSESDGLQLLNAAGVKVLHIFNDEEIGIHHLKSLGDSSHATGRVEREKTVLISGAGHTFGPRWSKDWLLALLSKECAASTEARPGVGSAENLSFPADS